MLDVSAPARGYDTAKKQKYRADVWACLIPAWHLCKSDARAHVLIMPSREGLEIRHLISLGVPEDRIVAVDKSAAVIATSKWRKEFPKVKFFAKTIGSVGEKLKQNNIVVCAANLDFCSNFCAELVSEYASFMSRAPRFLEARVAVTIAKGREGKALVAMIKKFASSLAVYNEPRCAALLSCAEWDTEHMLWGQGDYVSGKNPMSWFVVSESYIRKKLIEQHIEEILRLSEEVVGGRLSLDAETLRSKGNVENWVTKNFAIPFLERMDDEIKKSGGKVVAPSQICPSGGRLERAIKGAVQNIWRRL